MRASLYSRQEECPSCAACVETVQAEPWESSKYIDDLFVLDEENYWARHTDNHKYATKAEHFALMKDNNGKIIDLSKTGTLPSVAKALYLNDSWHSEADWDTVVEDVKGRPPEEQASVLAAWAATHKNDQPVKRHNGRLPGQQSTCSKITTTAKKKGKCCTSRSKCTGKTRICQAIPTSET